jgi:oxepin-CoA hydrolase/3-oxo-5,6-dehydrosuberyl-CoA semialdehyde dehydrogenase
LLDHLGGQDVISFTGSIETSEKLRAHPGIAKHSIRFVAERDSLNAAVLGPDITPEQPEFELFVREVVREMTAKAGQKCTAIRRVLVPRAQEAAVVAALKAALAQVKLGDPRSEDKAMGRRSQNCGVRLRSYLAIRISAPATASSPRKVPSSRQCCCARPIR